jgi:acyl-CoA reductase-like NAD-dependent aldehyde dehydrogenase
MARMIAPGLEWPRLSAAARHVTPEAFGSQGQPLNLVEGEWKFPGNAKTYLSPIDGTQLGSLPMLDIESALRGVRFSARELAPWSRTALDERKARVTETLGKLREHRELLAHLLMWEIGKPYKLAQTDVDRCISGVEWYVANIEGMLAARAPVGVISNIASWNYPMSVLMHAVLVQALAGNAVIAKTPTDGGLFALTVAMGLARRAGLPVSLVSGSGGKLSDVLVRNPEVDCLAFVGGRSSGRDIAASLYDRDKRYMLEMEGVNTYGIWDFSDWSGLAAQIKRGFDYGKQRCTAYPRFVVQRELFPRFLDAYLPVLRSLKVGNPLLVENAGDPLPALDFGPLINSKSVEQLNVLYSEAIGNGAVALFKGSLDPALFLPGQDLSPYFAPVSLLNVPQHVQLYHKEPFGPIDTVVVVDRVEQLVAEMNISNGSLVASLATDDPGLAKELAGEVRAFKIGVNQIRSRGDNDEVFGGIGQSWKGCFVGGKYLVHAVTKGPPGERLFGNFPDYTLLPDQR